MKLFLVKHSVLFVLLLVAIPLAFMSITRHELNGDELLTLNTVTGLGHSPLVNNTWAVKPIPPDNKVFTQNDYWARNTISNVLQNTASYNGNMVAYNILLYYFIKIAPVNDGLLRGLSALFYLVSIILVYCIAKKLFSNTSAALICAGLFMLNPFVLHLAHDLRGYSFVIMTTLFASLIIIKIANADTPYIKAKIGWGILLGLLYGISLLGHYFALYIIAGHLLYTLYNYFILKKNILMQVSIALAICFLFFIAWWANGGKEGFQSMKIQDTYILRMTSQETHTSFISLLMATVCFINSVMGYYFQYLGYRNSSFFYVLALPLTVILLAFYSVPINKTTKNSVAFLSILIVFCIVFLQLCCIHSGHTTSLIMSRFGAFISPYFMILLGYALYRLLFNKRMWLKITAIILLSTQIFLYIMCYPVPFEGNSFTYSYAKGNVEQLRNRTIPPNPNPINSNYIMQHYITGDTVIYNSFIISQNVNLYLRDARYAIWQEVNPMQKEKYIIKTSAN